MKFELFCGKAEPHAVALKSERVRPFKSRSLRKLMYLPVFTEYGIVVNNAAVC